MTTHREASTVWLVLGLPVALGLALATQGTGVIKNDPERNIFIPTELTMPLQIKAAYNGERIFFRYRWPALAPHILHDVLRYEDGQWLVEGRAVPGPVDNGLHEDRVAMMVDDGGVPEFSRYGGYVAIGAGIAGFTTENRDTEVTKQLPGTHSQDVALDDPTQRQLREAGYFLDLWHWRAGRSNPIAVADDQHIGQARSGDKGQSPYTTNWDAATKQPLQMFNAQTTGHRALAWDDVRQGKISQQDSYYLSAQTAVPFDPQADWKNGDTLPRRILRQPTGDRADIAVVAEQTRWEDGFWNVTLVRDMDTGYPLDDKIFREKGRYDLAISVHRNATGGRWHYVSLPYTLGLGRAADIPATAFQGDTPDWSQEWFDMTLFYPGQVNWPLLLSKAHPGAEDIAAGKPVRGRHSEKVLAMHGVEIEFNEPIIRQWQFTLLAGLLTMLGITLALLPAFRPTQKGAR